MLKIFEKFSFPSVVKRWTKDRDRRTKRKEKKEKKRKEEVKNGELKLPLTIIKNSIVKKRR